MARKRDRNNNRRQQQEQFRINKQIRVPEARLVGEDFAIISEAAGKEVAPGIFSTKQLQDWAFRADLDLVEISPKANLPKLVFIKR